MNFGQRKLPLEAIPSLRQCPIHTVQPYALMMAPVYILMKTNGKLIAVKGPLDFFTESELEKLRPRETFYLWHSVDTALVFRNAARRAQAALSRQIMGPAALSPAPYELTDAMLRIAGPLLNSDTVIEPFLAAVFVNELCSLLPSERLMAAREAGVERFEYSVLLSSWMVFLALLLGQAQLAYLDSLRERSFAASMGQNSAPLSAEELALFALAAQTLPSHETRELRMDAFEKLPDRLSRRISARLKRVREELPPPHDWDPSIFGEDGFKPGETADV